LSLPYKNNYPEPDLEEVFEDGCPSLSRRFVPLPHLDCGCIIASK
jgi:hypothetical protein